KNRNARADAEKLDVRNRTQTAEDFLEFVVAEKQGVAAAQEDVTDLGVLFEITKCCFELGVQLLLARATDHAASCAITAVARAAIGNEKEHAVRIAMHQPGTGI